MIAIIDQFPQLRNVKVFYLFPTVLDRENLPTPTLDWNMVDMSVNIGVANVKMLVYYSLPVYQDRSEQITEHVQLQLTIVSIEK